MGQEKERTQGYLQGSKSPITEMRKMEVRIDLVGGWGSQKFSWRLVKMSLETFDMKCQQGHWIYKSGVQRRSDWVYI